MAQKCFDWPQCRKYFQASSLDWRATANNHANYASYVPIKALHPWKCVSPVLEGYFNVGCLGRTHTHLLQYKSPAFHSFSFKQSFVTFSNHRFLWFWWKWGSKALWDTDAHFKSASLSVHLNCPSTSEDAHSEYKHTSRSRFAVRYQVLSFSFRFRADG